MVDDILTYCYADYKLNIFLNIELSDPQPHFNHISDKGLVKTLKNGIDFYHEALDKQDQRIAQILGQFKSS
jgi:pre-mRNA-splicing helicase BRR2